MIAHKTIWEVGSFNFWFFEKLLKKQKGKACSCDHD